MHGVALVLITLAAYLPIFRGGFIWDDGQYVTRNTTLRTWEGLMRIWSEPSASPQYYPMTLSTFWIEEHLWGLWADGYHITNVLLHTGSALLLWRILTRLKLPWGWWVAVIWAIHPINVESVAWVTERKNVLSGLFYLGSVYCYLRFDMVSKLRKWGWYPGAIGLFMLALLSKTVTSTFPAAMLLLIWWKRGVVRRRDIWPLAPMFVMGLTMGAVTSVIEKYHVGASGSDFHHSWLERCLIAARIIWFYLAKDVFPVKLSFIYSKWKVSNWQWGIVAAEGIVVATLFALRRRIGRGPVTAMLFFIGTLLPALGFVNVYPMRFSFVADHFQYLASIGIFGGIVGILVWGMGRVGYVLLGAFLPMLMMLSWNRTEVLSHPRTLWEDTIVKNPDAWMAHTNLGVLMLDQYQIDSANGRRADATQDLTKAETEFQETRRLRGDLIEPLMNLGRIAELRGDYATAVMRMEDAVMMEPTNAEPHFHLGRILSEAGKIDKGMQQYRKAIELNPRHEPAMVNLGGLLSYRGKLDDAIAWYDRALEVDPDSILARTNLGNALLREGKGTEAEEQFMDVLRIQPGFEPAVQGLRAAREVSATRSSQ